MRERKERERARERKGEKRGKERKGSTQPLWKCRRVLLERKLESSQVPTLDDVVRFIKSNS